MSKIDDILKAAIELEEKQNKGITASELSDYMELDRANISRYLNKLYADGKLEKKEGRPVIYSVKDKRVKVDKEEVLSDKETKNLTKESSLDELVGADSSLQVPIQQAKAAILYPPTGLHTIILGETGVGKSMFAEAMYSFAKESQILDGEAPFVRFNCADYADNPQLVIAQIFGVKKGAFTGAESDKDGLLKKADGGILFLDEIHRLSPQGQEMLFTFIDKGFFRPLGETEKQISVKLQIIAATTEDPKSYLLKTFTRRIPMTIILPPLRARSLKERYELLEEFIRAESLRLGESIYFNKNALMSFLLYDCSNNIGQLKSDLQLSCAKAFLNYKSNLKKIIIVEQQDLQSRVKRGIMKLKDYRAELDSLFNDLDDIICFSFKDKGKKKILEIEKEMENGDNSYFYTVIENKVEELKRQGLEEGEISDILNLDIEEYFRKYISSLKGSFRKEEISKIVNDKIIDIVESSLAYASKRLNREFDEKVYFGLALHLQGSIERIMNGRKIYHPKLNAIKTNYSDEFMVAMEMARIIEKKFGIEISLDEIGYITMFLAANPSKLYKEDDSKVGVLVIMHGRATATSMVEVANTLIGEDDSVKALDMPLTMKAEVMYDSVKEKIKEMDEGKGVIILADMGSLVNFGDMVKEETGITTRTVDMVSTLAVIEAGRKALNGRDINSIYNSCVEINRYGLKNNNISYEKKSLAIVTTCFTGEGSAEKLKNVIEDKIDKEGLIRVIPMNIIDKDEFYKNLDKLKEQYSILAVVGTVNLFTDKIPFISAAEIFTEEGLGNLNNLVNDELNYLNIGESLKTQIKSINCHDLINDCRSALCEIEGDLNLRIAEDVKLGIIMHLCFLVDKLKKDGKETPFVGLNQYIDENNKEFIMIRKALKLLEINYQINIADNDLAYIVKMVKNNIVKQ